MVGGRYSGGVVGSSGFNDGKSIHPHYPFCCSIKYCFQYYFLWTEFQAVIDSIDACNNSIQPYGIGMYRIIRMYLSYWYAFVFVFVIPLSLSLSLS